MRSVGADIFEYSTTINNSVEVKRIEIFENYEAFCKPVKYQQIDRAKTSCLLNFKVLYYVFKLL
jgi:hypothetical protein